MAKTLRDYQIEAITRMTDAFVSGATNTFRFRMATGTGKTITATHAIEAGLASALSVDGKRVMVLCHTRELVKQFRREVYREFPETKAAWEFHTYQSMQNREPDGEIFLLAIDEIHQGGQAERGVYCKVIEEWKPKFVLTLSATDYGVDEELFGERFGDHSFSFTFREGIAAGVLNNVELITIHTGLAQSLADGTKISGTNVAEVVRLDHAAGVDLAAAENIEVLERAKISAAIETCLRHESGAVLFYARNTKLADWGAAEFARRSGRPGEVAVAHSNAPGSQENIPEFIEGRLRVLFTARMFREGVDFPKLDVVFDTCPSVSNEGRSLIQGMGRVTRLYEGKGVSRYYVCVSPNASRVDVSKLAEERRYTPEQAEVLAADVELRAEFAQAVEQEGRVEPIDPNNVDVPTPGDAETFDVDAPSDPVVEYVAGQLRPKMRISVSRGPLIVEAGGAQEVGRVTLASLLSQMPKGYWTYERCLEEARRWGSPQRWNKGAQYSYLTACTNGWLPRIYQELGWRQINLQGHWTYERCLDVARSASSMYDLSKKSPGAKNAIIANGWKDRITADLGWRINTPNGYWTYARCLTSARAFTSPAEWRRAAGSAYARAFQSGWLSRIYAELGWEVVLPHDRCRPVRCVETGEKYPSVAEAARALDLHRGAIQAVLRGGRKSTGGLSFKYAEESA